MKIDKKWGFLIKDPTYNLHTFIRILIKNYFGKKCNSPE